MCKYSINADQFRKMFLAGAANLEANKEWINELNVFPVPDGDTGTNMTLTIKSAVKEMDTVEELSIKTVCKAISSGSLRGARGNSGVILSQLIRGFSKEIRGLDTLDKRALAAASTKAVETAYKAVMKPKEGTILTVARGMEEEAVRLAEGPETIEDFLRAVIRAGQETLNKTPEMLPVLKEAGVVDSGGQGLMQVIEGALEGYLGKEVVFDDPAESKGAQEAEAAPAKLRFAYCTELIIRPVKAFGEEQTAEFRSTLDALGDSVMVVVENGLVKIHVHTNDPGIALSKGLAYGPIIRVKIDNLEESKNVAVNHVPDFDKDFNMCGTAAPAEPVKEAPAAPAKAVGFITVSLGEGLSEIFRSLNVDEVIEGGQTMNPSTDDILTAAAKVNAKTIYILPNNKNVILAAEQAKHLIKDKKVFVIPSKTIPQGITALINYSPSRSEEDNARMMTEEMGRVKTGEVTYAVRDTSIDGKAIRKGDIMGLADKGLAAVGSDLCEVTRDMVKEMVGDSDELISVYFGQEVNEENAEKMAELIREACPDCEVEVNYGGQPIYYYVISVE